MSAGEIILIIYILFLAYLILRTKFLKWFSKLELKVLLKFSHFTVRWKIVKINELDLITRVLVFWTLNVYMRLAVYYILFLIGYIIFGIVMLVGLHLLISSFPVGSAQAENIGLANANILFRRTLDFNIFISVFSKNYIVSLIYGLKLFILNTCVSVSAVKHQFNPLILNVLSEALKNYTRDYFHSIEGYFLKFLHSIISLQTGIIYNYALFMFVGAISFIGLSFFLVYSPTAAVSFFKVVILLGTIFIVSKNINKKI